MLHLQSTRDNRCNNHLIASGVTIYLTHQNKKDQRELEKEIQQNEFNFSLKNLWYERQAEAIDELMGKQFKKMA